MFEAVVNLGIAFNLSLYLLGPMNLPAIPAATALSNYWGASYLTSLLGGFLSDAFLGNYWTIIIAMLIELVVWIAITNQYQQRTAIFHGKYRNDTEIISLKLTPGSLLLRRALRC